MSLHIAVDMDDVMLDFVGGISRAIATEYGVDLTGDDIDRWELSEILDPILGEPWWDWMRRRDWLWPNFPAMPGAIGAIERLRREGHYLEMVTSKPDWAVYAVYKWLGKWRPPFHRVTIVDTNQRKSDFTEADVLVDDRIENVLEFAEAGGYAILFSRPHNRKREHEVYGNPRVFVASGWGEVLILLKAIDALMEKGVAA